MTNELVVNASIIAALLRVSALAVLAVVIVRQARQFKFKSNLQPLKRLLLILVSFLGVSNLLVIKLHLDRIFLGGASPELTAFSTIANAGSALVVAIVLWLIYDFKQKD